MKPGRPWIAADGGLETERFISSSLYLRSKGEKMCYSIEQNVGYVSKPNSYTIKYCGMKDMS